MQTFSRIDHRSGGQDAYEDLLTAVYEQGRGNTAARFVAADDLARLPDPADGRENWLARSVIYGVVPRNVDPPGFRGITSRLDDLADLGVTALWLAPLTKTNPGSFGYDVTNYFELRPDCGTNEEFRALIQAAHQRGIRVLMDFVPNHTSIAHPYCEDAEAHGKASPYWDYYDRDADGQATHYFSWDHLPNLNYGHPDVQHFMLEAFSYWVREFGVDGFRLDAIWGIKERNPEWLARFPEEMRRLEPNTLLIAEASAHDPFYAQAGFDAAYDWTDELGHWAWEGVFDGDAPIGQAMLAALTAGGRGQPDDAPALRFLNNNDTGPRFITRYGIGAYRVALAMLLTLPGLPCLFTGDEVGAEFQPYESSGPIDWTDRHGLRQFTKKLIALRQGAPALHGRGWLPLSAEPAAPLFAFVRTAAGEPSVIVVLNFSSPNQEATIELPDEAMSNPGNALVDLWSGESVAAPSSGRLVVSVPGWGFRVLTDEG